MVVFHVFKFVQMAPNRAKHHILACKNVILQKKQTIRNIFYTIIHTDRLPFHYFLTN